jgi:hypothetical protein
LNFDRRKKVVKISREFPYTVFDRSFEHYGSFEHLHFPHSFAISRGYFAVPQLFINALHRKMMILDMKIILELCNERIGRKWVV